MGTLSDSVFGNSLILGRIFSQMRVAELKTCRQINKFFHCLATPYLTARAKVTVSVCRFNMYKISYQTWEDYFSQRLITLKSVPIANLFVQLRHFHSPLTSRIDTIKMITRSSSHITWLQLDVEFRDCSDYEGFCGCIFNNNVNHNISQLKINFKIHRSRITVPIGRLKLIALCDSVKELELINFPCENEWDDVCDSKNVHDFLQTFPNLRKLVITYSPSLVRGVLCVIKEGLDMLPKLESLEICLEKE
ncbi:hypothetical protein Fcan01_01372 [Folsomia candida]|uniref:Uncharacterized protein n=2 Tax=Folsomia candida TaxID=158441 RepID=A0A226EZ03_FOLCA|nr:hypothetical protein Fcan01_01372 [Folsomia candida]